MLAATAFGGGICDCCEQLAPFAAVSPELALRRSCTLVRRRRIAATAIEIQSFSSHFDIVLQPVVLSDLGLKKLHVEWISSSMLLILQLRELFCPPSLMELG